MFSCSDTLFGHEELDAPVDQVSEPFYLNPDSVRTLAKFRKEKNEIAEEVYLLLFRAAYRIFGDKMYHELDAPIDQILETISLSEDDARRLAFYRSVKDKSAVTVFVRLLQWEWERKQKRNNENGFGLWCQKAGAKFLNLLGLSQKQKQD